MLKDWNGKLRLIEYTRQGAYYNMALDLHLFRMGERGMDDGFLRFYTWEKPALSLGFFEPIDILDVGRACRDGIQIVRRPTGGRVVLHGDDLTYTVVMPRTAETKVTVVYRLISEAIIKGISLLGVELQLKRGASGRRLAQRKPCFGSVSRYEVTHAGRKVVGSAQRVGRRAILQHGSIPLGRTYLRVVDYLSCTRREHKELLDGIRASTCCLHDLLGYKVTGSALASALHRGFAQSLECCTTYMTAEALTKDLRPLAEAFRQESWQPQV